MPKQRGATRRTGQVRTGGRAAQVVQRVFAATLAELSRVGYEAMRVDDVAQRSGVNKTTIYRRWPTKAQLITAVILESIEKRPAIDTGTLRGDLLASLLASFKLKPSEQGVLRIMQMERSIAAVDALARRLSDELRNERMAMVRRGIARGELPKGSDVQLVVDLVSAPVQRALLFNEAVDESFIQRVLDVVLDGAAANAAGPPKPRSKPARAPRAGHKRKPNRAH
jgi:AcrR family transcriptional regulator